MYLVTKILFSKEYNMSVIKPGRKYASVFLLEKYQFFHMGDLVLLEGRKVWLSNIKKKMGRLF